MGSSNRNDPKPAIAESGDELDALLAELPDVESYLDPLSEICGPLDLTAGIISDENEAEAEYVPRTFCVAHVDPAFADQTWCGKLLAVTPTLARTDDLLYLQSENIRFKHEGDSVCASCVTTIRQVLGPGPKHHEGDLIAWPVNTDFSMN
jgi:hypothetical protein